MTQALVSAYIALTAMILLLLGYNFPRVRQVMVSVGFFIAMTAAFATYSNWLPQVRSEVPEIIEVDLSALSTEDLANLGEKIIFGKVGGSSGRDAGKGQCPLCHTFNAGDLGERAPNLIGIVARAKERIKEDRFKNFKTDQAESFKGSGRPTTGIEYIAESHTCPSCYVVETFGEKGSNDTRSPMPTIHKPAISLSIEELVAVDTWLYFREGGVVPPAEEIRAAYVKFIHPDDMPKEASDEPVTGIDPKTMVLKDDTPDEMVMKMGCSACHKIPTIEFAKIGIIGPLLTEGTNAARRIKSPEYKAAIKAGKAGARTPKDYVIESIMDPSAFIVPGFPAPKGVSVMPGNFAEKFTYAGISKLADFLLSLDLDAAKKDGLDRSPFAKEGSLYPKDAKAGGEQKSKKLVSIALDGE